MTEVLYFEYYAISVHRVSFLNITYNIQSRTKLKIFTFRKLISGQFREHNFNTYLT